jgi:antitoxin ParD1/3/4
MDDLHINLSDREYAALGAHAAEAGHASAEDYAAALIRMDLKAKAQEKLEALLLEGLQGEATEWTDADWEALRRRAAGD